MKNKKKIIVTIAGIVFILAGVVIFCIPIFYQTKNSIANDEKLDYINALIEKNQEALAAKQKSENEAYPVSPDNSSSTTVSSDNSSSMTVSAEGNSGEATQLDSSDVTDAESTFVIDAPIFDEIPNTDSSEDGDNGSLLMGDSEIEEELDPAEIASRLSGQDCVGVIACDKIDLCYAIVEGVEYANIGVSIGHFEESAGIGKEGNCALAGHNGGFYGRYFGDIKELVKGDEIKLTDLLGQEYTYNVTKSFKCEPTDVHVVGDLDEKGKFLTLVTCCENGKRRYIVRAKCTT
nr:class D sortase [Lachnospiraceae bacterium]